MDAKDPVIVLTDPDDLKPLKTTRCPRCQSMDRVETSGFGPKRHPVCGKCGCALPAVETE